MVTVLSGSAEVACAGTSWDMWSFIRQDKIFIDPTVRRQIGPVNISPAVTWECLWHIPRAALSLLVSGMKDLQKLLLTPRLSQASTEGAAEGPAV